jgi:NAD(P)H-dependent flavin oxidoreductase YrpB (nitropropane dioxygenase family)
MIGNTGTRHGRMGAIRPEHLTPRSRHAAIAAGGDQSLDYVGRQRIISKSIYGQATKPVLDGQTHLTLAPETGDLDAGLVWAGQVQGLIHDIPSCQVLIDRIIAEANDIITRRLRAG